MNKYSIVVGKRLFIYEAYKKYHDFGMMSYSHTFPSAKLGKNQPFGVDGKQRHVSCRGWNSRREKITVEQQYQLQQ